MRLKTVTMLLNAQQKAHEKEIARMQAVIDKQTGHISDLLNRVMTTNYREFKTFTLGDLPVGDGIMDLKSMDELAGGIFSEEELSGGSNGKTEESEV